MNLNFKTKDILRSYSTHQMHHKIAEFLWWWCEEFYEAVMTSAWRQRGIHSTGRAIDLRSFIYSNPQGMEEYINSQWVYDPERLDMNVVWYHNSGSGNHFHCQVHDRTVRNGRDP